MDVVFVFEIGPFSFWEMVGLFGARVVVSIVRTFVGVVGGLLDHSSYSLDHVVAVVVMAMVVMMNCLLFQNRIEGMFVG